MAFVVSKSRDRWELRESRTTPSGPRSRTLASFGTLTPEVLAHAESRSSRPLDPRAVRAAARRAGAPVVIGRADQAAATLVAEIAAGQTPRGPLRTLLLDALDPEHHRAGDSARAAGRWAVATPERRGETLFDLLALVDRLPAAGSAPGARFPRIDSRPR